MSIHPTAIVAATASIPESCNVGPYCTIGPDVQLGENCELVSHVVLDGKTHLGARNRVYSFACLGVAPQDLKYRGEATALEIGDDRHVRLSRYLRCPNAADRTIMIQKQNSC